MINIIFEQATLGPYKVIKNLFEGLKLIGFNDITINLPPENSYSKIYILNSVNYLYYFKDFIDERFILGPNLFVIPENDKSGIVLQAKYKKYIHPSSWAAKAWERYLRKDKLDVWPVGIDTNEFNDTSKNEKSLDFFVYFKKRDPQILNHCFEAINRLGYSYRILEYGKYNEADYRYILKIAKAGIWIGRHESQGIALQESLSSNVPLLIFDVRSTKEEIGWPEEYPSFPATVVPYWDDSCGEKIFLPAKLEDAIRNFYLKVNDRIYNPREFILENLNLAKQAKEFLEL